MCRQSREALGSLTYELAAAIYRRAFETAKVSTLIYRIRICWRVKVSLGYPTSIYHISRNISRFVINCLETRARQIARCLTRAACYGLSLLVFLTNRIVRSFRPVPSFLCWQFIEAKLINFIFLHLGFATRKSNKVFSQTFLGYCVLEFFQNFLATSTYLHNIFRFNTSFALNRRIIFKTGRKSV